MPKTLIGTQKNSCESKNYIGNVIMTIKYIMGVFIVPIFALLVLSACGGFPPPPASELVYDEETAEALKNEYDLIEKMPNATESDYKFHKYSNNMSIGAKYKTKASYEEIREHYDATLKEHGWEFIREEKVTDWGRDFGGKILRYRKGDFVVAIEYAGDKIKTGWRYAFSMCWGEKWIRLIEENY